MTGTRIALVSVLLLTAGCTSLPEAQLEARDYRRIDFAEQFKYDRAKCQARGGSIYMVSAGPVDRNGIPAKGTRYICN